MQACKGLAPRRAIRLLLRQSHFTSKIQTRPLSLSYNLHEPPAGTEHDFNQAPIIILHGLFGSKQNNRSISRALARDLKTKVFAVDLRNHGDSPHSSTHDYTSMASDVEKFIASQGLQRVTMIGHSMGAKAAMAVALRAPRSVSALIPVDNAPVDAVLKSDFGKYVQGMRKIADSGITRQADADKILENFEPSLPIRQFLLTNLVRDPTTKKLIFRVPLQTLGASLDLMGDFPFRDPDQVRYDGPTLIVRGTKSPYVSDDILPLIGRFFPLFEVRDIDSGHWVISEQPGPFKDAVVEFLRRQE